MGWVNSAFPANKNSKLFGINLLQVGDPVVCCLHAEQRGYIRRVEEIIDDSTVLSGKRIRASKGLSAEGQYTVGVEMCGMSGKGNDASLYWPVRYMVVLFDHAKVPKGWGNLTAGSFGVSKSFTRTNAIVQALCAGHFQRILVHAEALDEIVEQVGTTVAPVLALPHYTARPLANGDFVVDRHKGTVWLRGQDMWSDVSRFLPLLI